MVGFEDREGPLRAAVAGGSIGGLCAGLVLRAAGWAVDVYERTPGAMRSSGAGIVAQLDLYALLRRHGAPKLPTTRCSARRYLALEGGQGVDTPMPQRFTSWEAIYRTLRAVYPDEHYHPGRPVAGFAPAGGGVAIRFADGEEIGADVLVCADGGRSDARRRLLPDARPRYAGYLAWRGTVAEGDLPPDLAAFFDDRFTFCEARSGGHALCYFIPGAGTTTESGRRRLNWVWYARAAHAAVARYLTDRRGVRHEGAVPPGDLDLAVADEVRATATRELHPRLAELVGITAEPFVQVIADATVPRMVFGRVCLLGDAAFVVRPHTAGGTSKAAADALALGEALAATHGDLDAALARWERERLAAGMEMARYGMALGKRFA